MRLELTERDIWLLKVAFSVLAVFLLVRFGLMPGIARYQELSIENELLADTVAERTACIEAVPVLEKSVQERQAALLEVSKTYYERLENREIDELLTGTAVNLGLFPVSLSISEVMPGVPEAYRYATAAQGEAVVSQEYMGTAVASMVLRGEEAAVFAFIDEIEENYPAVQVRSVRLENQAYLDVNGNTVEQMNASFSLAVYMCDPGVTK